MTKETNFVVTFTKNCAKTQFKVDVHNIIENDEDCSFNTDVSAFEHLKKKEHVSTYSRQNIVKSKDDFLFSALGNLLNERVNKFKFRPKRKKNFEFLHRTRAHLSKIVVKTIIDILADIQSNTVPLSKVMELFIFPLGLWENFFTFHKNSDSN